MLTAKVERVMGMLEMVTEIHPGTLRMCAEQLAEALAWGGEG